MATSLMISTLVLGCSNIHKVRLSMRTLPLSWANAVIWREQTKMNPKRAAPRDRDKMYD